MIVNQATKTLIRSAVLKSENSLANGIVGTLQKSSRPVIVQKRFKRTDREEKNQSEEEPEKSKLATLAKIAAAGTVVAIIAAKYDDDIREWSRENLPILDETVKVLFQEEDSYLESLDKAHRAISNWIKNVLHDIFVQPARKKKEISDVIGGSTLPGDEICEESKKSYQPPDSAFALNEGPKQTKDMKELKDLEDRLNNAAQETMQASNLLLCAVRDKANLVDHLDNVINANDPKIWEKLRNKREEAKKSEDKFENGKQKIEDIENKLKTKLGESKNLSEDVKAKALENLNIVKKDIKDAEDKLEKEKAKSEITKRSWDKVKQARMNFSEDLETLSPNIWLNDEKLNITADSLDPLIQNTLKNINFLEKELARLQTVTDNDLNSSLDQYKKKDDPESKAKLEDVVVTLEIYKEMRRKEEELQKSMLGHKAKCEKGLKQVMKQQAEVYSDLTNETLKMKEREVERKMNQIAEEKIAQARAQHKMEIAKMIGRIQGANEAIEQRGDNDKEKQVKQQYWSAAQSLMAAVSPVGAGGPQSSEPKPLRNEIANVSKVKPQGDDFVDTVLQTIPQEAVDRGVPSEATLRERFLKVENEARKWAAIQPGEIRLVQLLLAKIQSALYINPSIPQEELDNEPAIDVDKLNNYDILYRARYFVDQGDYDQAIRYLNLLKGPSSKVASDWVKDAKTYLETIQAAKVLLAHATVLSS